MTPKALMVSISILTTICFFGCSPVSSQVGGVPTPETYHDQTPPLAKGGEITESASLLINIVHANRKKDIPDDIEISISPMQENALPTVMERIEKRVYSKKVPPGNYQIDISGKNYRDFSYDNICLGPHENSELTFPLIPDSWWADYTHGGGTITGRLLNPQGKPLDDMNIGILIIGRGIFGIGRPRFTHLFEDYVINNLGSGYFRVWLPSPEMWGKNSRFYLEASSPGLAVQKLGDFLVRKGDKISLGTIKLLQKESILSGQVLDKDTGLPLPGITIISNSPNMFDSDYCETDENGFYKITNLPPGPLSLRIERWAYQTKHPYKIDILIGPEENKVLAPIELQKKDVPDLEEKIGISDVLLLPIYFIYFLLKT